MIVGIGLVAGALASRGRPLAAAAIVLAALASGARAWVPPSGPAPTLRAAGGITLEVATPPRDLLTEERYMVNSTFYHPESLIWRFPDKEFIGLPLDSDEFDEFQRQFPDYRTILWHETSIQDDLLRFLVESGRYRIANEARNADGRRYLVLEKNTDPAR
jgi:hypothetical protein